MAAIHLSRFSLSPLSHHYLLARPDDLQFPARYDSKSPCFYLCPSNHKNVLFGTSHLHPHAPRKRLLMFKIQLKGSLSGETVPIPALAPHPTTVTGRAVHWMESGNIPWDSFPAHLAGVLMEIEQRSVGAGVSPLFGESCLFKGDFKATGYKPVRTISINARIGTAEGAWIESWGGGLKGNECALTLLPLARASGHLACWLLMTTLGPEARTGDPQWLVQLQTKLLVARRPSFFFFFFDGREIQKSCELIS